MRGAAAEAAATATAAVGLAMISSRFRHQLLDALFEADEHGLGALDARTDRQLDVDADLAFVGLRLEFETDPRISTSATTNSAKPVANTVGRCASARCSMRA